MIQVQRTSVQGSTPKTRNRPCVETVKSTFVVRKSPFLHHPMILNPHYYVCLSLCMLRSWWKPAFCRAGDFMSCEPHHVSSFLDADGEKVGTTTTGRPRTLSTFRVRLITGRRCLVGVKMSEYSKCDWLLHDSCILINVVMFKPHSVRRGFHIPLVIVHPI